MPVVSELHGGLTLLDGGVVPCGEAWVHEPVVAADYPQSSFRRIDVLFLGAHEVDLARVDSTPPLREIYGNPRSVARPMGVWHLDDGAIDTFAYRREGDFIHLEFSAKSGVATPLRVRLYEYTSARSPDERMSAIQIDAMTLGDEPGLRKSGALHEVAQGESIAAIAAQYGSSKEAIVSHPSNALATEAPKVLFVPQVDASEPVALGPLLDASPVDSEDGRPRFSAEWPIAETGYDLLHPAQWLVETELGDSQRLFEEDDEEFTDPDPVLPPFAVLDANDRVLGVAPSPAEIVALIEYADATAADGGVVLVQLDGTVHAFETNAGMHELGPDEAALLLLGIRGVP